MGDFSNGDGKLLISVQYFIVYCVIICTAIFQ
jgi:hypothetical protein